MAGEKNNQITGNTGLYYVCYILSKNGLNVMPTSRNAKGIDVVAYSQCESANKFIGIQVKTLSKKSPVPLGTAHRKADGDFWIIVTGVGEGGQKLNCYILKPSDVDALKHRGEKNGKVSYWLQPKAYDKDES